VTWIGSESYWLTRFAFQKAVGLVFLIAFLNALNQFKPLLGERGLLPVPLFVKEFPFRAAPSLFVFSPHDSTFTVAAWTGVLLSCLAVTGVADYYSTWFSMLVWGLMWALYLSFVNVGQTFYAFGWESILLETGFYAIFLGSRNANAPTIVIWLLRWLLFRVMFGAGLIKMRGDPCWRDLTCLNYYYETQPMPNPLSWYFHWGPAWTHQAGVLVNHVAELAIPFCYFMPQPVSAFAGVLTILFQGMIFASGNLSWLNFLTMVLAISTLDDRALSILLPIHAPETHPPALLHRIAAVGLAIVVAILSVYPVRNMFSRRQVMNTIYNRLHLVGTYGAFGAITRPRYELVVEGTDEAVVTPSTKWREYEFKGKPGDRGRMPPQVAPYHLRLDWLMWFAAMSSYERHPWFLHFLAKLLEGDRATLGLLRTNPFPNAPPRYVRALLYEYHFTSPQERAKTGQWWKRDRTGVYFPPVSLRSVEFRELLELQGWMEREHSR
jgi:hypothetical protein